jgi:predicted CopG family antitoxin
MVTNKLKRIAIHETVYQQLKSLGFAGDSFNDVLLRILKNQPILDQKG